MGVRFEVNLAVLDPTLGSEIRKTRPCLIVSPDEMNLSLRTVIVAPMTTGGKPYPSRIPCNFGGKDGHIALDRIHTVDRSQLASRLGVIDEKTQLAVLTKLQAMFAP